MSHQQFMLEAIALAKGGIGRVSPNPLVGCLIVKNKQIVGRGYHQSFGGPHAEVYALQEAGEHAKEATVYVTLEPCAHTGKTPPCTDALIHAGIKQIYIATSDPHPLVNGKGIAQLKAAGIAVDIGLCEHEAYVLNQAFFHAIKYKKPLVIAKWAMSLDGKTITHEEDNSKISNTTAHQDAHALRAQVDAIIIGSQTAIKDNPLLTVRHLANKHISKQPARIIVSATAKLPTHLNLFNDKFAASSFIATTALAKPEQLAVWREKNIKYFILPTTENSQVDLSALLYVLAERNILSVLVEGGMTLLQQFFQENLINKFQVYLAPVLIGNLRKKQQLAPFAVNTLEENLCFTTYYVGEKNV